MLHQDASTHAWLPGDASKYDLVVTMDDATSAIYSLFLVDQEGTASSLRGVREVVAKHGLFCSPATMENSEAAVGVLMYFHRRLDEVRTQRALRYL